MRNHKNYFNRRNLLKGVDLGQSFIILTIFIIPIFNNIQLSAQETKLKIKDRDEVYEEYYVLESDRKIKHGSYLKFTRSYLGLGPKFFSEYGQYYNDKKDGYWEKYYKNSNEIEYRGFFKENKKDSLWVYFYSDGEIKNLVEVKSGAGIILEVENLNKNVSSAGKYKDGRKMGIWEYYSLDQKLIQSYDFDNDSLLYDINIEDLNNKELTFIGGEYEMQKTFHQSFDFDALMKKIQAKINLDKGEISVKVLIGDKGEILNKELIKDQIGNKRFRERALEFIDELNYQWSPKYVKGKPITSEMVIHFILDINVKVSFRSSYKFYLTMKLDNKI